MPLAVHWQTRHSRAGAMPISRSRPGASATSELDHALLCEPETLRCQVALGHAARRKR
jgi:hypothetical protein